MQEREHLTMAVRDSGNGLGLGHPFFLVQRPCRAGVGGLENTTPGGPKGLHLTAEMAVTSKETSSHQWILWAVH